MPLHQCVSEVPQDCSRYQHCGDFHHYFRDPICHRTLICKTRNGFLDLHNMVGTLAVCEIGVQQDFRLRTRG